ncbi:AraC family transcriptional regulator [Flavobacterium sp. 9AF]|uniref:helix-turn-helix domain-containing protein n=1 Tax=Flavobacterium sp. 9AF TaxID=2653142 RepID=UPI0012F2C245|nr:helix-turn-helix transcriptional regulator [Flavobacterium sp. 9AF]VXA93142.1 AraC family transcriptional regulator [Flavobacterium sp. 9AF]
MIYTGQLNEFIRLEEITPNNGHLLNEKIKEGLSIIWAVEELYLQVDGITTILKENEIIFITEYHNVVITKVQKVRLIRFNRAFYCILDHDSEVGCKGVLFFGAAHLAKIEIPILEFEKFETLWKMFVIEMQSKDELKSEMLQMMLKRMLILCIRIYKEQTELVDFDKQQFDLVREYNYLVEVHFRTKHQVADYATLLHKSPKTLSNVFKKIGKKTPLQIIQDRIMLEAVRLLGYTDKSIKEIAYEVGYEDIQTFSRFFKKIEGISPSEFKKGR